MSETKKVVPKTTKRWRQPKTAFVHCNGGDHAEKKFDPEADITSCQELLARHPEGHTACQYGCLGFGDCVKECPFDAIHINAHGVAEVDKEKCKACNKCVKVCPRHLIGVYPYQDTSLMVEVSCSNRDKGKDARGVCAVSCIACGICERTCPVDAIHVIDQVARIDQERCVNCTACEKACPRQCIHDVDHYFCRH